MNLLRIFLHALARLPLEILAVYQRVIIYLLMLLARLLKLKRWLKRTEKAHCFKVPPHVARKPDPCLYSQSYLMSRGFAVTWDNPDIWITRPDGTPVPSSDLQADRDYVVNARIHNASFDPAIATEVRCYYRPWSFNSPYRQPVDARPDGTSKVVILHLAPWGNGVAQFNWHTPAEEGHFCLQVECAHADDKNPANNVGQENTNVYKASPGQELFIRADLFNNAKEAREFEFKIYPYSIPEKEVTFQLKTSYMKYKGLEGLLLRVSPSALKMHSANSGLPQVPFYSYKSRDKGLASLNKIPELPQQWQARINGRPPGERYDLLAGERFTPELSIKVPADSRPGDKHRLTWLAQDKFGRPAGGVTLIIETQ